MHNYLGNYCLCYTSYYKNYGIPHYWYFQVSAIIGVPRNFVWEGGGFQKIQLRTEDREWGSGGGSPLVRGSGGSCNLVQEISFRIVKVS